MGKLTDGNPDELPADFDFKSNPDELPADFDFSGQKKTQSVSGNTLSDNTLPTGSQASNLLGYETPSTSIPIGVAAPPTPKVGTSKTDGDFIVAETDKTATNLPQIGKIQEAALTDKNFKNQVSDHLSEIALNAVKRGLLQGEQADILNVGGDPELDQFKRLAEIQRESKGIKVGEGYQKFNDAKTTKESLKALAEHPIDIITELSLESLSAMARHGLGRVAESAAVGAGLGSAVPVIGTAAGAATGLATGIGLTSLNLEYSGKILESLAESGVNVEDENSLKQAFNDEAKIEEIRKKALQKGIPIALFDMLSLGIAGKIGGTIPKKILGKEILGKVAAGAAEMAAQSATGGAGELAGEIASGEKINPSAIIGEMIGDVGMDATTAIAGTAIEKAKQGQKTEAEAIKAAVNPNVDNNAVSEQVDVSVGAGQITPEQGEQFKAEVQKAAEINKTVPESVTDVPTREKIVTLIADRETLKQEIEGMDEVFAAMHKQKINELNEQIAYLANPPKLEKNTTATDEKYGTIDRNDGKGVVDLSKAEFDAERAKMDGLLPQSEAEPKRLTKIDFREEAISEAIDSQRQYLEKEILSETEYLKERESKKGGIRKVLDRLSGVTYDKYLKQQQNRLSLLNKDPLAYFEKELADEEKWKEKHPEDVNERYMAFVGEMIDNLKAQADPQPTAPVIAETPESATMHGETVTKGTVTPETTIAEQAVPIQETNESKIIKSDFDSEGDLTDEGFEKATATLTQIVEKTAEKYGIPKDILLDHFSIKNGQYRSSLRGILDVGNDRDYNQTIALVKKIAFRMFPDKIDELNDQIEAHSQDILNGLENDTPIQGDKSIIKVVSALNEIDDQWNEVKPTNEPAPTPTATISPEPTITAETVTPQAETIIEAPIPTNAESDSRGRGEVTDAVLGKQIESFGVAKDQIKPIQSVISKIHEGLKKAGLTAAKTVSDWVGIGKGEEKPYTLKMNGKDVQVKNTSPDVINGFYSPLEKVITDSKFDKLPAKQWAEKFANGEEAKWTGLKDWLAQQQGSVSKADIQQFLKDNRIQVVEVVKGVKITKEDAEREGFKIEQVGDKWVATAPNDDYDFVKMENSTLDALLSSLTPDLKKQDATKFSQYQLEGQKENYKEVLVTMPSVEYKPTSAELEKMAKENYGKSYSELNDAQQKNTAQYVLEDRRGGKTAFKSSHFEEPNILVHLRMNTRTDADGNKVLFLEEVQSDWGQKGKKEGFSGDYDIRLDPKYDMYVAYDKNGNKIPLWYKGQSFQALDSKEKVIAALKESPSSAKTPQAPFVTDTNAWTKLALKYALKEAVAQGATKIAWTTGEQQNSRYDLSKQVDYIDVFTNDDGTYHIIAVKGNSTVSEEKSLKENQLEGLLGKDLTNKIIEDTKSHTHREGEENLVKTYRGNDLSVGGKGMKGFYGSPTEGGLGIVGNVAKSLLKQEPKIVKINAGSTLDFEKTGDGYEILEKQTNSKNFTKTGIIFKTEKEANSYIDNKESSLQHSIDITPEIKASVKGGQPLFKDAEAQYRIESGKNIIEAIKEFNGSLKATVALTHEIMHPTVVAIIDGAKEGNVVGVKHTQTIVDEYNKANPKDKVTVEQLIEGNDAFKDGTTSKQYRSVQEFIAESWEKYHTEGGAGFSKAFQAVLEQITKAFQAVYSSITGKQLTPELRQMFDEILGKEQNESTASQALTAIDEAKRSKKTPYEKAKAIKNAVKDMGEIGQDAVFIDENFDTLTERLSKDDKIPFKRIC